MRMPFMHTGAIASEDFNFMVKRFIDSLSEVEDLDDTGNVENICDYAFCVFICCVDTLIDNLDISNESERELLMYNLKSTIDRRVFVGQKGPNRGGTRGGSVESQE